MVLFSKNTVSSVLDRFQRSRCRFLLLHQRRAYLITSRVRLIASIFAISTPIWILVDWFTFSWPLWGMLAILRWFVTVGFMGITWFFHTSMNIYYALRSVVALQILLTTFFLMSQCILHFYPPLEITEQVAVTGYQFLPYVIVVSLAVFPLTLIESGLCAMPIILATLSSTFSDYVIPPFHSLILVVWLLLLLLVAATAASVSQLHFITVLVNQSARDVITNTYTRRIGEEVLDIMFSAAVRESRPISVAFFDLDDFKFVNDQFGHEIGDYILHQVASVLRNVLRHNDILVRWGGEEFLVIMPFTSCDGAASGLKRLQFYGFIQKPNGHWQTVSVGVAERITDGCESWQALVEWADRRLHKAKQEGKSRIILCQNRVILL